MKQVSLLSLSEGFFDEVSVRLAKIYHFLTFCFRMNGRNYGV